MRGLGLSGWPQRNPLTGTLGEGSRVRGRLRDHWGTRSLGSKKGLGAQGKQLTEARRDIRKEQRLEAGRGLQGGRESEWVTSDL